jgi:hypothetical protein
MQIICKPPKLRKRIAIVRKMLFVVLMVSFSPSSANLWVPYWYDDEVVSHYDLIWIRTDGNKVSVEVMKDLFAVQTTAAGKQYLSFTSVIEYDCGAETYTRKSVQNWSKSRATGDQVGEIVGGFVENEKILPRTMASELFAVICGRRIVQIIPFLQ